MLTSTEEPQCPICLYHPVAAKMTRCGHVYCWPCILHYLALSEKKSWRKCPICYEAVHIGDLKSTISKPYRNYSNGEFVTLQLMYRDKDSLRVFKSGSGFDQCESMSPFSYFTDNEDRSVHSKLLLARPNEILDIIQRERNELKCQLTTEGLDCPDSIFVQQALHLLDEREQQLKREIEMNVAAVAQNATATNGVVDASTINMALNANAPEFIPIVNGINNETSANNQQGDEADGNSLETVSNDGSMLVDEIGSLTLNDINISQDTKKNSNRFYFYQSNDGQHLYLHSINIRMLQAMYGSLETAPFSITGRILQKQSCSMSEDLRKRLKYLQHLPVSCQFEVVEIALEQPIVSKEIQAKFQEEIDQRLKNRRRRAREEQKREKHINLVNERQIGKMIHSTANIDVYSDQQFPVVS